METVARRSVRCPRNDVWETAGEVGRERLAAPPTASERGRRATNGDGEGSGRGGEGAGDQRLRGSVWAGLS